jgi:hypothetical protein
MLKKMPSTQDTLGSHNGLSRRFDHDSVHVLKSNYMRTFLTCLSLFILLGKASGAGVAFDVREVPFSYRGSLWVAKTP